MQSFPVRTCLERLELANVFADGTGYVNAVHESLSPVQAPVRAFLRVRITNGCVIMNTIKLIPSYDFFSSPDAS